jgi:hypothetical protein
MIYDKCQVCAKELPENYHTNFNGLDEKEKEKELFKDAPTWEFHPKSLNCCSYECHSIAIKAKGGFILKERLRNMNNMNFESFNEIFNFPLHGGYALDMYDKMRRNTWFFLLKLDNNNFIKIITNGR